MSNYSVDRLYQLLPAVYRQRDAEQGYPLRDLVEILAGQAKLLEGDIFQLYENWFVETCEPWVIPYIGDLIGVRGTDGATGRRAEVANTLGYRQAKGTAVMLERLARDVTGWPARVVEYFARLETTQHVDHVRPRNPRTPDLRRTNELELLGGPFETASHTLEARRIAVGRGRYNIPDVGIFLWRLQAYPLERIVPHPADASNKNFFFNVLGMDQALFTAPAAETAASPVAGEINVPAPIRRRAFHAALASYYGKGLSIEVWTDWQPDTKDEDQTRLRLGDVVACDLTDWNRPRPSGKVAIDPVLGRLSFSAAQVPERLRVSYRYGFSGDLGGGVYEREASFTHIAGESHLWVGVVDDPDLRAKLPPEVRAALFPTLQAALDRWNGTGSAVIEILDSRTYAEALTLKEIPAKGRLEIRAANEQRPALLLPGELKVTGDEQSGFEINGLLVSGGPVRLLGRLDRARLQHTTLVPGKSIPALIVEAGAAKVSLDRSILGAVRTDPETQVELSDAIVDAVDGTGKNVLAAYTALDGKAPGGPLTVSRCTLIGEVRATALVLAENSLFLHPVTARRRQEGCVRFCHVPPGSRTPRRFHCQPPEDSPALAARVRPRLTSPRYGDPGYCQLTADTPPEIRRGAEDESEMGAFSGLRQPQREDGLRIRLEEYLRVGLEAGILFAT
ncbi:MAG TPA: hypothetical protein VGM86_07890 [Thermoanaerobaculia bacterium]